MISVGSEVRILPGPPSPRNDDVVVARHGMRQSLHDCAGVGSHIATTALPLRGGDVAQLGEHLLCKQGVVGSNPIVSTIYRWLFEVIGRICRGKPEIRSSMFPEGDIGAVCAVFGPSVVLCQGKSGFGASPGAREDGAERLSIFPRLGRQSDRTSVLAARCSSVGPRAVGGDRWTSWVRTSRAGCPGCCCVPYRES